MTPAPGAKRYLGDAVYVEFDGAMVMLTTEDGIRATNTIYLEAEVLKAFLAWYDNLKNTANAGEFLAEP